MAFQKPWNEPLLLLALLCVMMQHGTCHTHPAHTQGPSNTLSSPFSLRIHFVRHGETEANKAGTVLGQIDSPLTDLGVRQSKFAHDTYGKNRDAFWRKHSSDLGRCQHTSRIILGLKEHEGNDSVIDSGTSESLRLDVRLRERAKGVREGLDKRLSYDEAMALYKEKLQREGIEYSSSRLPLLESDNDVFERLKEWIEENLHDAYTDFSRSASNRTYDILAISHSGTVRIAIEKLVGEQLPPDVKREAGKLFVPNTSKTIIDFTQIQDDTPEEKEDLESCIKTHNGAISWRAELVELTNVSHLVSLSTAHSLSPL